MSGKTRARRKSEEDRLPRKKRKFFEDDDNYWPMKDYDEDVDYFDDYDEEDSGDHWWPRDN